LYSTSAGSDDEAGFAALFMKSGTNIINITIALTTSSERDRSDVEIADNLRSYISTFPEIVKYSVVAGDGGGMGMPSNTVDVEIFGYNFDQTTALANDIAEKVKKIKGARDVTISREKSKPELRILLDQEKMSQNGLNTATVSSMVHNRL
jgi:HAE1 family hydrophobic/amphiphilic exporter-1